MKIYYEAKALERAIDAAITTFRRKSRTRRRIREKKPSI